MSPIPDVNMEVTSVPRVLHVWTVLSAKEWIRSAIIGSEDFLRDWASLNLGAYTLIGVDIPILPGSVRDARVSPLQKIVGRGVPRRHQDTLKKSPPRRDHTKRPHGDTTHCVEDTTKTPHTVKRTPSSPKTSPINTATRTGFFPSHHHHPGKTRPEDDTIRVAHPLGESPHRHNPQRMSRLWTTVADITRAQVVEGGRGAAHHGHVHT
ncbi:hypothetical protein CPB85DRAFT_1463952, partial [Mucidula mucida]